MVYSPFSKVSTFVAAGGSPNNSLTLVRYSFSLCLSPRFFSFWLYFCDSFLYRITKVSRAQTGGFSWAQLQNGILSTHINSIGHNSAGVSGGVREAAIGIRFCPRGRLII